MISPSLVYSISPDRTTARSTLARRRALVQATIQQAEELALDIEHRDRPLADGRNLRVPGGSSSTAR
jgi:hypothetical protein